MATTTTSVVKNHSYQSPTAGAFLNRIAESFDKGGFFDLGHPLLNRIAESFVKAAGIGAIQALSREAYLTVVESVNGFPDLRGESNQKSVEALVKNIGTESLQWGLAARIYSDVSYGLKEARGAYDWRNILLVGAAIGAMLALTTGENSHEQVVRSATFWNGREIV
ncbi:outer envelope pore protein 16-2, chloroplastic [Dorcoceras hygrometricum]|uniref:Outer envelope pore protein 16-2, chloroplastic n=1 Tax=Dorcoceras hygrometricum TaxID=472368 RepID=A0A2Z7CH25_9LAMI|nr:outer envelope pore protein 16-2, chloroplastic [Dorcoceras hygrometricum]